MAGKMGNLRDGVPIMRIRKKRYMDKEEIWTGLGRHTMN
jgi:hypothetical protein